MYSLFRMVFVVRCSLKKNVSRKSLDIKETGHNEKGVVEVRDLFCANVYVMVHGAFVE